MASNHRHALLRQWHMLKEIPRAPQTVSARTLCERLDKLGFGVSKRTVERDLLELCEAFPLAYEGETRPYGWHWMKGASNLDVFGLTLPEALTLALVEQHLRHHLPPSTTRELQPYFESAERVLSQAGSPEVPRAWVDKVRSIAPQQPLVPPRMDEACQHTVYQALMEDRQLTLHYRKRDTAEPTRYQAVHPLAVVQRGGLIYLVCMFGDYDDVRTIALHRLVAAEARYEPARRKEGFDIDAYIASGQFGVIAGEPVRLRAVFSRAAGEHLFETPLCEEQELVAEPDGRLRLEALVPNTRALVWWLLGFGDGVVVEQPAALREELASTARKMVAVYG